MLYSYQKATLDNPYPAHSIPSYLRLFPILISSLGLLLIGTVVWPLFNYQVSAFYKEKPIKLTIFPQLLSPVVSETVLKTPFSKKIVLSQQSLSENIDYTKASNWFTTPSSIQSTSSLSQKTDDLPVNTQQITSFNLSLPGLGIKNALVKVNGEDLSKSLIHYSGTALPGEYGSVVVFGHSTLPQLFDPENYLTIFATLPTINVGSDIFITADNVKYTYRISRIYEVKPQDIWVLTQTYDKKILKLITCVPPGTKLRRLVVEANLIKI